MKARRQSIITAAFAALLVTGVAIDQAPCTQQVVVYTYDAVGRLTSATYDDAWVLAYEYDASGNITSIVSGPVVTAVADGAATAGLPTSFALGASSPNPLMRRTELRYQLPQASPVRLTIYDASGRLVRTLVDAAQPAGFYAPSWDASNDAGERVSSGAYFYRLEAGGFVGTRKMMVLR